MKIKVYCKEENRLLYEKMLSDGGFIVSDTGDLSFYENDYILDYLIASCDNDKVLIYLKDIIIIERYDRDVVVRTKEGVFKLKDTLEYLENLLKPHNFIRISQSVILQRSMIVKISPGLSMRFHLLLKYNIKTDVTRSYYYSFKKFIGL